MHETKQENTYLRTQEAAAYVGIKTNTLAHWVSARKIKHYKLSGRCVVFDLADLNAFIASKFVEVL